MSPGYRPQDELWTQDTDVFEPVVDSNAPGDPTRQGAGRRSRRDRFAIIGLALLVVAALIGGGIFAVSYFTRPTAPTASPTVETTAPATTSTPTAPSSAPTAGAPISQVIAWIQAGTPASAAKFHTATTDDGTVNDLGSAIAFISPSQKIRCMTPLHATSHRQGLTCMAALDNPPSRPAGFPQGNWVGDWVEFPGPTLGVGRIQGDPGQFTMGDGATLAYGSRLTFDDYDCRMDQTGLLCANETTSSAMQLSSAGAVPFGCLDKTTSKEYGLAYTCDTSDSTTTTAARPTSATRTSPITAPAVVGKPCDTPGQKAKSASGATLICDVAGDSGLRWFEE